MHIVYFYDINKNTKIIGSLGQELGKIITIEGVAVDDDIRRMKSDEGKTLLKISHVEGQKLENEKIIEYQIFPWLSIVNPLSGSNVKFIGFETGTLTGIPQEAFEHIPYVTAQEFHFDVYFQILKQA